MAYVPVDVRQKTSLLFSANKAPVDFSHLTMNQTMGDNSVADFAPPNPAAVPQEIQDGIKRLALLDPEGSVVPQKIVQPFLPNTELTRGAPSTGKKMIDLLPKGVQSLAETFLQSVQEGPIATLLPTLARDTNEKVRLAAGRLEDLGVPEERAASLAFYATFSRGNYARNSPEEQRKQNALQKLAELRPTDAEQRSLRLTAFKQNFGEAIDVGGLFFAPIEKTGLARAVQLMQTGVPEEIAPKIFDVLRKAGVEEKLAHEYAPILAKADFPAIEKGIANLEKMQATTKVVDAGVPHIAESSSLTIPKELEPLALEARKYGSAEEFVKAEGQIVYRASPSEFPTDTWSKGTYFAPTEELARYYSESHLPPGGEPSSIKTVKTTLPKTLLNKVNGGNSFTLKTDFPVKFQLTDLYNQVTGASVLKVTAGEIPKTSEEIATRYADEVIAKQKGAGTGSVGMDATGMRSLLPAAGKTVSNAGKIKIIDKLPPVRTAEELTSLERSGEMAQFPTENLPELPKLPLSQGAKKVLSSTFKNEKTVLDQMRQERDLLKETIGEMPGKQLAKYESPKTGELPEVTGKPTRRGPGGKVAKTSKFGLRGDDIVANEFGFRDLDDARTAFDAYKKQREQVKAAEEFVRSKVQDYRSRKAIYDEVVRYVKAEGVARREQIQAVQDFFKIGNDDMRRLMRGERDIRLMGDGEFENFLKRLEGKATEYHMAAVARMELEATIFDKEFVKLDNLRKALKLPTIQNMTPVQMRNLDEFLQDFQRGDEFLGVRQIETLQNTDLNGIYTMREAREKLLAQINIERTRLGKPLVTLTDLEQVKVAALDPYRYDVALARRNPLYELMVRETHGALLHTGATVFQTKDRINELFAAARATRKTSFLDRLIPTDREIFRWLEAPDAEKIELAKEMTVEELEAAMYVRAWYAEARDFLVQQNVLKRYVSDYVTHIRRGFLEAWHEESKVFVPGAPKENVVKRAGRGLLGAFREAFSAYKQQEAFFTIMNQKTGDVLPLEKFFQFSMRRTGQLIPTKNVAKAFLRYVETFEKKRMLDSLIPKLDIYVHSLSPNNLTPRGLEMDDTLKQFFKRWMNTKKGRPTSIYGLQPGGQVDWALRTGVALTRIMDLGLNLPVGIASNFGAQFAAYRGLGEKAYALGIARLATKDGTAVLKKYRNMVGESVYHKMKDSDASLGDSLINGFFGIFSFADRKARQVFLLGSMTPEEFKAGDVSAQRLIDIKLALGRQLPIENMQSILGKTAIGKVGTQYRTWAVPLLSSTLDDVAKGLRAVRAGDAAYLKSPEFAELMRTIVLSGTVGLGVYGITTDKTPMKDRTFTEKLAVKSAQDALSLISALNPSFWTTQPRLEKFLYDLGTSIWQILAIEKNKKGELTGIKTLENTIVPAMVRQVIPPAQAKAKSGKGLPALPKLPKLPTLPKLPKIH